MTKLLQVRALGAATFIYACVMWMRYLCMTAIVLLANEHHVLVLEVAFEVRRLPPLVCCLRLHRGLHHLALIAALWLVLGLGTPLGWFLLDHDVSLRFQSLLLHEIRLILQEFLGLLLVDTCSTLAQVLFVARYLVGTSIASGHFGLRGQDRRRVDSTGVTLLAVHSVLFEIAALPMDGSFPNVVSVRLHPVVAADSRRRLHRRASPLLRRV